MTKIHIFSSSNNHIVLYGMNASSAGRRFKCVSRQKNIENGQKKHKKREVKGEKRSSNQLLPITHKKSTHLILNPKPLLTSMKQTVVTYNNPMSINNQKVIAIIYYYYFLRQAHRSASTTITHSIVCMCHLLNYCNAKHVLPRFLLFIFYTTTTTKCNGFSHVQRIWNKHCQIKVNFQCLTCRFVTLLK